MKAEGQERRPGFCFRHHKGYSKPAAQGSPLAALTLDLAKKSECLPKTGATVKADTGTLMQKSLAHGAECPQHLVHSSGKLRTQEHKAHP